MTLLEILEALGEYCYLETGKIQEIQIVLPDSVIDKLTDSLKPAYNPIKAELQEPKKVTRIYMSPGSLDLIKQSEYKIIKNNS